MKKLIVLLVVLGSVFAHALPVGPISSCSDIKIPIDSIDKIGHEYWPWSAAKPFPWASIQGVWTIQDSTTNLLLSFKVTRSTDKMKQLAIEIYDGNDCKKKPLRGVGVVNGTDKNIVSVMFNNILLKMAYFNNADLNKNSSCRESILGATFYRLTENGDAAQAFSANVGFVLNSKSVILKKLSYSPIVYKCKSGAKP